jgi:hypothetical protein
MRAGGGGKRNDGLPDRPVHTRERESEKRERENGERRKRGHEPVRVSTSHVNRTGVT